MVIVLLKYKTTEDIVSKFRAKHLEFIQNLYDSGICIASGRNHSGDGGTVVLNVQNSEIAREIFSKDPFLSEDIANFEFIAFTPSQYHNALATIEIV